MQKGKTLEFQCLSCQSPVPFSIFELEKHPDLSCPSCEKKYHFDDPTLLRQLQKFEALCRQIRESEEILGSSAVGIDVGSKQIKVPFKLLLTRMSSCLDLTIGGTPLTISFRFEPIHDISELNSK
jgi:hypothetical protein